MSERRRSISREDALLVISAVVLGLIVAAAFGAFRAVSVSDESTGGRFAEFAATLLWPGALIFAGVAAAVWVGWKANLD